MRTKRFHSAPGGLLAFCAISEYDGANKSPRLVALSFGNYARSDGSKLISVIGDYICTDRVD